MGSSAMRAAPHFQANRTATPSLQQQDGRASAGRMRVCVSCGASGQRPAAPTGATHRLRPFPANRLSGQDPRACRTEGPAPATRGRATASRIQSGSVDACGFAVDCLRSCRATGRSTAAWRLSPAATGNEAGEVRSACVMRSHAACAMCRHVIATEAGLPGPAVANRSTIARPEIERDKRRLPSRPFRNCVHHAVRIHGASLRMMLFLTGDSTNDGSVTSIGRDSSACWRMIGIGQACVPIGVVDGTQKRLPSVLQCRGRVRVRRDGHHAAIGRHRIAEIDERIVRRALRSDPVADRNRAGNAGRAVVTHFESSGLEDARPHFFRIGQHFGNRCSIFCPMLPDRLYPVGFRGRRQCLHFRGSAYRTPASTQAGRNDDTAGNTCDAINREFHSMILDGFNRARILRSSAGCRNGIAHPAPAQPRASAEIGRPGSHDERVS